VGDQIYINTQVYDGSFNVVNDALVRTAITGPSSAFEIEPAFVESGRYEGVFAPIIPGSYRMTATAWRNDIIIGEDELKIIVASLNREFLNTRQNYTFLKKLADKTGGEYFAEEKADEVLNALRIESQIKHEDKTYELWNRLPVLLLVLFLLTLEWFIRKRKGLA
jgi:hypothetical protein